MLKNKNMGGLLFCFFIALPAWFLGKLVAVIGAPVFGIFFGMVIANLIASKKEILQAGINFTAKKILQYAVVLLGFNMNLSVIMKTGQQSLPIIIPTIGISLVTACVVSLLLKLPANTSILIGVGSSVCGGSAIAATAPVINAKDEEIAESMSVIFLFNVIAALVFPSLGTVIGLSNEGFGLFAGTAVNDTSSVTAAASAWDDIHSSNSLDTATVVKLTRTLAIIPITLLLSLCRLKTKKKESGQRIRFKNTMPLFILFFLLAAIFATCVPLCSSVTIGIKNLSKYLIVMAMSAIGLNTNFVRLVKTGGKSILLGFCCWMAITVMSLSVQKILGVL